MEQSNNYKISINQPIPNELRTKLPINNFLFVKVGESLDSFQQGVTSTFHNTSDYTLMPFYKSISNIL
jgi:hypothetical protein